jgi:hypothetical protein
LFPNRCTFAATATETPEPPYSGIAQKKDSLGDWS